MTVFNPIRAFRRGYQLGEARARREIEQQLREQAALHRGLSAADAVRDRTGRSTSAWS